MPLIRDTPPGDLSPYLEQHRDNPVDWHPWTEEALAQAVASDRPIFLSIGYSACHWCHVMAHESFEDPAVAAIMNEHFVCIKVDREERPDIDAVYMEAVQTLTGSGGWPMSVFLTPDGRPFFGGTYFPPQDRPGMHSFTTVLTALAAAWTGQRSEVEEQADSLAEAVTSRSEIRASPTGSDPSGTNPSGTNPSGSSPLETTGLPGVPVTTRPDLVAAAAADLHRRFDAHWGGFSPAPKFPQPFLIDLALLHARRSPAGPERDAALLLATRTLDAMAAGGIHDHLGGGFARYSTDERWLVPHFEKMLYDQAGLLRAFTHGWLETGDGRYLEVMEDIVGYVTRDLTLPEGGVCSAEDADSEGVEGRFYVWSPEQVAEVVGNRPGVAEDLCSFFGIAPGGNFDGASILHRPVGDPLVGSPEIEWARERLREHRATRIRPGLDDKVLTEWNAMWASALAEAASVTGRSDWAEAAEAVGDFLWANLRSHDGRWLRTWQRSSGPRILAFAADHGWLIECATRLGELTGSARWTDRAVAVADQLLDRFCDDREGGFYTVAHDGERLIARTKDLFDGATPSANAVAAMSLARIAHLTGIERFRHEASRTVNLVGDVLSRHPTAFALTVMTADLLHQGGVEVVIVGDRPDLVAAFRQRWRPEAVLAWGESTDSPLWAGRTPGNAYVCRNSTCRLPAPDVATLLEQLSVPPR